MFQLRITRLPGIIEIARKCKTERVLGNIFQTRYVLKDCNHTNETIQNSFCRQCNTLETDIPERCTFIGLLYLAGTHCRNRQSLGDLWGTEGVTEQRGTKGRQQITWLLFVICFLVLLKTMENCATLYEKLETYRSRCRFKHIFPLNSPSIDSRFMP